MLVRDHETWGSPARVAKTAVIFHGWGAGEQIVEMGTRPNEFFLRIRGTMSAPKAVTEPDLH